MAASWAFHSGRAARAASGEPAGTGRPARKRAWSASVERAAGGGLGWRPGRPGRRRRPVRRRARGGPRRGRRGGERREVISVRLHGGRSGPRRRGAKGAHHTPDRRGGEPRGAPCAETAGPGAGFSPGRHRPTRVDDPTSLGRRPASRGAASPGFADPDAIGASGCDPAPRTLGRGSSPRMARSGGPLPAAFAGVAAGAQPFAHTPSAPGAPGIPVLSVPRIAVQRRDPGDPLMLKLRTTSAWLKLAFATLTGPHAGRRRRRSPGHRRRSPATSAQISDNIIPSLDAVDDAIAAFQACRIASLGALNAIERASSSGSPSSAGPARRRPRRSARR